MQADEALEKLRIIARQLLEAEESLSFGVHPTFKAGKKTFAVLERHQHSVPDEHLDRPSLTFKVDSEFQRVLCAGGDYFVAPYVGKHGWVYVLLDANVEWDEIEALVIESYWLAATKRMLKALDDGS